jgi:UrcA family protein
MNTIRTKLYSGICCLIGTAAALALTTPAGADPQDPPSTIVKYGDLDIATPTGAKVLYFRIQHAARVVCPLPMSSLEFVEAEHGCIAKAIDNAVRSVNSVALTELRFGTQVRLANK